MKYISLHLLGMLIAVTISGCAEVANKPPEQARLKYRTLAIYSDPPGAHVYAGDKYWGETQENTPIKIVWNYATSPVICTLTLKKRGYETTVERVSLDLKYGSVEEAFAANDDQKVVVVLELPDQE